MHQPPESARTGQPVAMSGPDHGPTGLAPTPVLAATFILAFCSIVYELLLGQILSAFLGNTVLRYSVTIGLYMFSMGMGALLAGEKLLVDAVLSLQRVELLLTLLGALAMPLLLGIDVVGLPVILLATIAHLLIIVVGVLTGFEIPLLIEIRASRHGAAGQVLGVDYAGAFLGTVAFALWFYPILGIFATALITAALNAIVGILLPIVRRRVRVDLHSPGFRLVLAQAVILVALLVALYNYGSIEEAGIGLYIAH